MKYVFPQYMYDSLIVRIMNQSLLFREIYYERQVNNVYFDTSELGNFLDAVNGTPNRSKTRVRWYGELKSVINPKLEYKYKRGFAGEKTISDFHDFGITNIAELVVDNLAPTLVNTYKRRYFATPDELLRVTIDRDLRYYRTEQMVIGTEFGAQSQNVVLELKFERDDLIESSERFQSFGWRICQNSKYVNGVNAVHYGKFPE